MTMKTKMKRARRAPFEYHADRSRELLKVFNEELGFSDNDHVDDVVQRVVDHPSSRFWVSEERAWRIISSMRRRPLSSKCHPLRREMFEEIYTRSMHLCVMHPDWSLKRCVYYVVNHEAPKFYLAVATAHALICQERNRCRVENMLKLRRWLSA